MRNIFQSICLAAGLFVASTLSANGQSRIERIEIQSENFENLIGVSATREMMVYLPDGYDESRADYAVLYGFHTFFEDETALFENYNIATLLDAAISEGRLPPVIVITPDFSTPMNHSLFADSPVTGNFLTFALEDMVPAIDARYRTIRDRNARGLFGNHIGAYGAIKIAARRPDLFGAVYGLHPVATTSTPDGMVTFLNWEEYFEGVAKQDLSAHWSYSLFTSFFQAFLPNPNNPPYFVDIPVTLQDGERIGDAALLNKLSESLPLIAEVETYADNLKQLNGFKYDWGRQDPNEDHLMGNLAYSDKLLELGIAHEAESYVGGWDENVFGPGERIDTELFPFFKETLDLQPVQGREGPDYATAGLDLSTPQASAYSMMVAMYQGSTAMVDQVFAPDATLNRLRADGEVQKDGLTPWREWVGTLEVGQADEELFNLKVEQFDRLASVWAPFVIRYEGEIVGCGVNQFVMVDYGEPDASEWRIVSGIDVQAPRETCVGFKK